MRYLFVVIFASMTLFLVFGSDNFNEKYGQKSAENNPSSSDSSKGKHADDSLLMQEYMLCETEYPECPKDIDRRLYDLMIAALDIHNLLVDMEHSWRADEIVEMDIADTVYNDDDKAYAADLRNAVNEECRQYDASGIKDNELREKALRAVEKMQKVFNTPLRKMTKTYNVNVVVEDCMKAFWHTEAFRILCPDPDACASYFECYLKALKQNKQNHVDDMLTLINSTREIDDCLSGLEKIQRVIDSEEYNLWLPMIWQRWRYLEAVMYGSMSKDGAIANWYYNKCRMKCYFTMLRYVAMHPDHETARAGAAYMLMMENIRIYGSYMYGNQTPNEDLLYFVNIDDE